MKYTVFGRKTGLRVSEFVLGTGNFGMGWGHGTDAHTARAVFDAYLEAGGNFIDTANNYQFGQSEQLLSEMIRAERDNLVLASKYTCGTTAQPTMLTSGNSRKNMIRSVEASLKRLKTDYIDIYWVHISDGQTPVDEIVRGFDDLVTAGKIHYPGFSNFPAWRIATAAQLADLRGFAPIAGLQIEYNLMERTAEQELLPMAEAWGLGVAFWSPLAGGTLTGKYRQHNNDPQSRLHALGAAVRKESSEKETAILDVVENISRALGITMQAVSLAWIRQKHAHTALSAFTIIGPRTVQQLEANLTSLQIALSEQHMQQLNEVSARQPSYPHEIITNSHPDIFGAISGKVILKHPVA